MPQYYHSLHYRRLSKTFMRLSMYELNPHNQQVLQTTYVATNLKRYIVLVQR